MPIDARETTWNLSTIEDFRAHGGVITVGPLAGANLLLMTSTGAQSERPNVAPLGYTRDGDRYVVVGSNSGRSHDPDWLRNIQDDAGVVVEVGRERFRATARVTSGDERRRLLDGHIAAIPIFAQYEAGAGRELPVVTLDRVE